MLTLAFSEAHGLINYIDNKAKCRHPKKMICKGTLGQAKCRHPKKIICKGTLGQVFIRIYRLETFSTLYPFPPSLCQSTVYTDNVWLGVGGGVESCWRPFPAGVNTLFLTRFRTYKIARPPLTKT